MSLIKPLHHVEPLRLDWMPTPLLRKPVRIEKTFLAFRIGLRVIFTIKSLNEMQSLNLIL